MHRIELLLRELDHTYDKEGWYPPLGPALAGLTAAQASWRPPGEAANTIWETVNHLLYFKERLLERLRGGTPTYPAPDNDATFDVAAPGDEAAWQATVARMEAVHRGLREVLAGLADADFDRGIPKERLGTAVMDIILHDAYHTGQLIQLRKLQGSWPARRHFD